jgi:hypothetical protein
LAPEFGRKWGKGAANFEFAPFFGDKFRFFPRIVNQLPVGNEVLLTFPPCQREFAGAG